MKSGFYTTSGDDQLSDWTRRSSKALPEAKLAPKKKRLWSLVGCLLPVWSTAACRIPVKPLHLRSMLSKSMRCTKNFSTCRRHWSTERCQFFSMIMPNHTWHIQHFRSWTNWVTKFCLFCHIHLTSWQPTTTSSRISKTFYRGKKHFHNQQNAENALQELIKPWSTDFYAAGINKLISHWQKCVDCNGSYFD